jgi:hypothetical protein
LSGHARRGTAATTCPLGDGDVPSDAGVTPCAGVTARRRVTAARRGHAQRQSMSITTPAHCTCPRQAHRHKRHAERWSRTHHTLHAHATPPSRKPPHVLATTATYRQPLTSSTAALVHARQPCDNTMCTRSAQCRRSLTRLSSVQRQVPHANAATVTHGASHTLLPPCVSASRQRRNGHTRSQSLALRHNPASLRLRVSPRRLRSS